MVVQVEGVVESMQDWKRAMTTGSPHLVLELPLPELPPVPPLPVVPPVPRLPVAPPLCELRLVPELPAPPQIIPVHMNWGVPYWALQMQ